MPINRLFSTPFSFVVSAGVIPSIKVAFMTGLIGAIGLTYETVWPEGGVYAFPAVAAQLTISSDDAADDLLGTGLRTVLVNGLDEDYNEISESVEMTGTTPVTTANSYLRVQTLVGLSAGSGKVNAGNVYIGSGLVTAGKPVTVVNVIPPLSGISRTATFTVPSGKRAMLTHVTVSNEDETQPAQSSLVFQQNGVELLPFTFSIHTIVDSEVTYFTPLLPETDVENRVLRGAGPGICCIQSSFTWVLYPDNSEVVV